MSRIRSKDTTPELVVRHLVHRMRHRFRLYRRDLPGHPDLVLARHRKVIFIHGCFWHRHGCKRGRTKPATNPDYWEHKRQGNTRRHQRKVRLLKRLGWDVHVVWECETGKPELLTKTLASFLSSKASLSHS